jgi:hypothetical protein
MMSYEPEVLADFLEALSKEETMAASTLEADDLGLHLVVALNELNLFIFSYSQQEAASEERNSQFYVMWPGVVRLVSLMLQLHQDFSVPMMTIRTRQGPFKAILEVVAHLGFIQHGRRVAETTATGLSRISRTEEGAFEFLLPERLVDEKAHERNIDEHFRSELARLRRQRSEGVEGKKVISTVDTLLSENVYVWAGNFIGYDADPLLDEYFFQRAWSDLQLTSGYDSFNEHKTFDGVPFLKYLLAVAYVNSLCLKHEAFCKALVKKEPNICLEDILTISADRAGFVKSISDALNLFGLDYKSYSMTSVEEAWKIYEVLALTRRNLHLLESPGAPLPCIIEFSEAAIIKFTSGRHQQMEFMLGSLRRSFRREYDNHQRSRERSMQRALRDLFTTAFPGLDVRENVRLRIGRRVITDVDFALIDRRFGDLFLFQLKFQDPLGSSFRITAAKVARFRKEIIRWLDAVRLWQASTDEKALRGAFRVSRGVKISRVRKLIVARHHAYPLRAISLDEDVAYANWDQLVNSVELMKHRQGDFRTLAGLFALLRQYIVGADDRYHYDESPVEYCLNSIKFIVRQESSASESGDPDEKVPQ